MDDIKKDPFEKPNDPIKKTNDPINNPIKLLELRERERRIIEL